MNAMGVDMILYVFFPLSVLAVIMLHELGWKLNAAFTTKETSKKHKNKIK
jgi:hypothetical protein